MNVKEKIRKIKQQRVELGIGKDSFPTFLVDTISSNGLIVRLVDCKYDFKSNDKIIKNELNANTYLSEVHALIMLIFKEDGCYKYYNEDMVYICDLKPVSIEKYILYLNMYYNEMKIKITRKERKELGIKYNPITEKFYL